MKKGKSKKLKAAFLLVVFALNTLVGFSCSIGLDMGFNTSHHHDGEATEIHVQIDGRKQQHHYMTNKHHQDKKDTSKKDDCCNDKVLGFQNLDKNLNQSPKTAINAPLFVAIFSGFFGTNNLKIGPAAPQKYIVPNSHPPPDIRIAIQSFQI